MALKQVSDGSTPYPQWTIDRLSDFVEFLERHCKEEEALFRGQASDWSLRPKLGRLRAPQGRSLLEVEEQMLSHFERAVVAYLPSPPTSIWELSALAQHHGMATRLLDWTLNPLTALWFALDSTAVPNISNAVVWMFCPQAVDVVDISASTPTAITAISYWKPRHISPRIRVQGSVFTVHPFDQGSGNIQALQNAPEHHSKLMKVLVPASAFISIRYHLDRCGINAAVVYPELDGLARHIEWLYRAGHMTTEHTLDGANPKSSYQNPKQEIAPWGKSDAAMGSDLEEVPSGKTAGYSEYPDLEETGAPGKTGFPKYPDEGD